MFLHDLTNLFSEDFRLSIRLSSRSVTSRRYNVKRNIGLELETWWNGRKVLPGPTSLGGMASTGRSLGAESAEAFGAPLASMLAKP